LNHRLLSLKRIKTIYNATKSDKKPSINILRYFRSEKNSKGPIKSNIIKENIWINKISDEPTLWLKATALDAEHEFTKALPLYLKDVRYCLDKGLIVRAALSCSCAANCMVNIGHIEEAYNLYAKAASIYVKNAHDVMDNSIREALWSLQQAYENYSVALDQTNAEHVYDNYLSIVSKISPFDNLDEKMEIMNFKKASISNDKMQYSDVKISPLNEEIKNAINEVFTERSDLIYNLRI
jgi:hypothetical protein